MLPDVPPVVGDATHERTHRGPHASLRQHIDGIDPYTTAWIVEQTDDLRGGRRAPETAMQEQQHVQAHEHRAVAERAHGLGVCLSATDEGERLERARA